MIQEITFLEFLEVILSFTPYILLSLFIILVGWTIIWWLESHYVQPYGRSFYDEYIK